MELHGNSVRLPHKRMRDIHIVNLMKQQSVNGSHILRIFQGILQCRPLDSSEYQSNVGRIHCLLETREIIGSNWR